MLFQDRCGRPPRSCNDMPRQLACASAAPFPKAGIYATASVSYPRGMVLGHALGLNAQARLGAQGACLRLRRMLLRCRSPRPMM